MSDTYDGYHRSAPPNDWSLTEKIKALRALHGWTQQELADRAAEHLPHGLRLSRRGISGLEKGNDPEFSWPNGTYMHAVHIIAIATALGVPPSYLDREITDNADIGQLRHLLSSIDLAADSRPRVLVKDESGTIPLDHVVSNGLVAGILNRKDDSFVWAR